MLFTRNFLPVRYGRWYTWRAASNDTLVTDIVQMEIFDKMSAGNKIQFRQNLFNLFVAWMSPNVY